MSVTRNPSEDKVAELIAQSDPKAAKWFRDLEARELRYWPVDWVTYSKVAKKLDIGDYEKGIAVSE